MTRVSYDSVHELPAAVEKSRLSRGFAPAAQVSHKPPIVAGVCRISFLAWRVHGGPMSRPSQGMTHCAFTKRPDLRHSYLVLALHIECAASSVFMGEADCSSFRPDRIPDDRVTDVQ